MNTAANLLSILVFLAALYTILGLLCGIAEKLRELTDRPYQRARRRRTPRRRARRRALATAGRRMRAIAAVSTGVREETGYAPRPLDLSL
jgi:hypothetical protein